MVYSTIKFNLEKSDTQLPFLDIMINKEGNEIFMDIYSKPLDSKYICPLIQTTQSTLKISESKLRNAKIKEKNKILNLILTFNPSNTKTLLIIKQILKNSKTSDRMKDGLDKVNDMHQLKNNIM